MISKTHQVFLDLLKGNIPTQLEEVDTNELFELFHRHRLFNLAPVIIDLLENDEQSRWKEALRSRTIKSLHQTSVLTTIIESFKKDGIEVVPLKGPVLAQSIYGNIGDRHYSDLDVLIRNESITDLIDIAERIGFEVENPNKNRSSRWWSYYFKYKQDIGLVSKKHRVFVELHTGIHYHKLLPKASEDVLLQSLSKVKIGEIACHSMNLENTFIYLVVHGVLHQYFRLFWIRDIAYLLNKEELDHRIIISVTKELRLERALIASLLLSNEFFGVEIPVIFENELRMNEKKVQKIQKLCADRIQGAERPTFWIRIKRHYMILLLKPGIPYKFAVLWSILQRKIIGTFYTGH